MGGDERKSRQGNWTPLELFPADVQRLEATIGALLGQRRVSDS